MTTAALRKTLTHQPFRPFILHLTDGRTFEVRHPEFMAVGPSGRIALLFLENGTLEHLDVLHITGVEIIDAEEGGGSRKIS